MKKTATIHCQATIELSYDEASPEFQQSFKDFKLLIQKDGELSDMLEHVAYNIIANGSEQMVEGVGYLKLVNRDQVRLPFSGITVEEEPQIDCDIDSFNKR